MNPKKNKGFTLVEIMIAALISSMVVMGSFEIFKYSTDYFDDQDQSLRTQQRLRFAVDYIKQDLKNIGKMSSSTTLLQSKDPKYCGINKVDGMSLFDNENSASSPPAILKSNGNNLYPDRFRAWLDVSAATPLVVDQQNGLVINISPANFQLTTDAKGTLIGVGGSLFDREYDEKGLVRIFDLNSGYYDIVQVSSKQFNNGSPRITLAQNTCAQINCNAGRCMINPLHLVEYVVTADAVTPSRTMLVRRRIDINGNPIDNTDLILAEQVVNFQIWGDYDSMLGGLPTIQADEDPLDDRGNIDKNQSEDITLSRNSRRLRALKFLVSIRQDREDPNYKLKTDNPRQISYQERTWFALDGITENGYAKVNSLVGEVETSNIYHGIW
jgi:prepilin-type N-terminal cleavage/methylation domain-containing protein